jgi:predicted amidohydrolase YtcJ
MAWAANAIPARAQSVAGPPDTILRGGSILTMNDRMPRAQAVAVKDGKIFAVGSLSDTPENKAP